MNLETSVNATRLAGVATALRFFSLARGLLALLGLAVVLAISLPAPREALLRQAGSLSAAGTEFALSSAAQASPAGPVQAVDGEGMTEREQRAVAEFISKRYRVAQDAVAGFVSTAYRAGSDTRVDPLLILAVMAIESRYNPVAESVMGAKGLMQVIPKFHLDKLMEHGGESALLEPEVNIQVGARILREYLRKFGETETALQMYAGAFDDPGSQYANKVLAERARFEQLVTRLRRPA